MNAQPVTLDTLRANPPDLRFGIDATVYNAVDPATRQWLTEEHARQHSAWKCEEAERARELADAVASVAKRVEPPTPETLRGELARIQALLFEASTAIGRVSSALPDAARLSPTDADAAPTPPEKLS